MLIKEVIERIGEERLDDFFKFMCGKTIGFDNGVEDYYECDVEIFERKAYKPY